jgi:hypothetical protein
VGALLGWAPIPPWYGELAYSFYVATIGDEPFDLFGFHVHQGTVRARRTLGTGVVIEPRYDLGRIDGEADAAALRRAGLVPPFVPLEFEDDPRAAWLQQGSLRIEWPLTPRVTAEARAGAQTRSFDEDTLEGYLDFLAETALEWTPRPGMALRIEGARLPVDVFGDDGSFLVRHLAEASFSTTIGRSWDVRVRGEAGWDVFDEDTSLTGRERRDRFFGGDVAAGWQPRGWLRVEAFYRARIRSSNASDEDTERNRIALRAWLRY